MLAYTSFLHMWHPPVRVAALAQLGRGSGSFPYVCARPKSGWFDIFGFEKSVMKTVGCRVGSVARTAGRKAGDEFAVELRLVIVSIVIILYRYYFHGVCVIRVMKLGNFRIVW